MAIRLLLTILIPFMLVLSGCATTSDIPSSRKLADGNGLSCDCDYRTKGFLQGGGCKIVDPAPPNTACYCKYLGFWTCNGTVVQCESAGADACKNPSRDKASCDQGGGDCGGY